MLKVDRSFRLKKEKTFWKAISVTVDKKTNNAPWPEVIAKARQIEGPKERLNYLIEHQPYLPLHPELLPNSKILLPQYIDWWLQQGEKRYYHKDNDDHYTTIEKAIADCLDIEKVVIGFYISQPWTWEDKHIFGSEQERTKATIRWISQSV